MDESSKAHHKKSGETPEQGVCADGSGVQTSTYPDKTKSEHMIVRAKDDINSQSRGTGPLLVLLKRGSKAHTIKTFLILSLSFVPKEKRP